MLFMKLRKCLILSWLPHMDSRKSMAEKYPEQKDGPFPWFFLLTIALNVDPAFSGCY